MGRRAGHPDPHRRHACPAIAYQTRGGRRSPRDCARLWVQVARRSSALDVSLSQRLLAGSFALIAVLLAAIVVIAGTRLNDRLASDTEDELRREAGLVGLAWSLHRGDPDNLADSAGQALQRRVTLIDPSGIVVGDSKFN